MEYIVILDPDLRVHEPITDSHGFIEKFSTYEDAFKEGLIYKLNKDCSNFAVFGLCTDERNHII